MRKYYRVYISDVDSYEMFEVARFTSKGMMFACLDSIKALYVNTHWTVQYDR